MATHSRSLSWEIPWAEEPGGLQSMGSQSVRHDQRPNNNKHVRDTDFSAYMKGRKEGDNLCGLSITGTDFCVWLVATS